MGTLLSVARNLESKTDDEENKWPQANAISSPNNSYNYYPNSSEKSENALWNDTLGPSHQWRNLRGENSTISVPKLRGEPSLAQLARNHEKLTSSAVFVKENAQENVVRFRTESSSRGKLGEEKESDQQWRNYQMENLTISVPKLRLKPSLAHTSVNHFENKPENVCLGTESSSRGKLGEEKERERVKIKCRVAAPMMPEVKRIKHYSSSQRILLVGEGDFSFSTCLATAFGWASNMVATSLDSKDFLAQNYENALSNLEKLSIRKCKVMHEVDATKMANHEFLGRIKFDCIVFNFPFAGFFKYLPRDSELRLHRNLVNLFLKNAKAMLSENGEIHISHKTNGFHKEWELESVASSHRLRLIEAVGFNLLHYPGYNTKRGFGGMRTSIATLARPINLDLNSERVIRN